jgi:Flp pilus assembly protein TadG
MRRHEERGQALVEFALLISIVILLMVGLFDLGRVVFVNNTLSDGARHGARQAIIDPRSADYCTRVEDGARTAIRNQPLTAFTVHYIPVTTSGIPSAPILLCNSVNGGPLTSVGAPPLSAKPGDRISVALAADVDVVTPFVAGAMGRDAFALSAASTMQTTFVP